MVGVVVVVASRGKPVRAIAIVALVGLGVSLLGIAASEAFEARDVAPDALWPKTVKLACLPFGPQGIRVLLCREK